MSDEKVKIIEANYNIDKKLAKIKVKKVETNEEVTWALTDESLDSLIGQISGKVFKYSDEQRETLCKVILGIEFINKINIDIANADIDKSKEKSVAELQHHHDEMNRYPFYELEQEAIEETMKESQEE